jgi:hypothetical protein
MQRIGLLLRLRISLVVQHERDRASMGVLITRDVKVFLSITCHLRSLSIVPKIETYFRSWENDNFVFFGTVSYGKTLALNGHGDGRVANARVITKVPLLRGPSLNQVRGLRRRRCNWNTP